MSRTDELKKSVACSLIRVHQRQKNNIENKLSCEKIGIYPAQHRLLMELAHDNEISQKELSKRLHVSPATITISIKKLVKDGYVKKNSLKNDSRYNMITITDKGRSIIEKSVRVFDAADSKMLEGFTDSELEVFHTMLIRMYNNLETY